MVIDSFVQLLRCDPELEQYLVGYVGVLHQVLFPNQIVSESGDLGHRLLNHLVMDFVNFKRFLPGQFDLFLPLLD